MQATDLPLARSIDSLLPWLRIVTLPGISRYTKTKLLRQYETPQAAIEAAHAVHQDSMEESADERIGPLLAKALRAPVAPGLRAHAEASLAWASQAGNHLLTFNDAAYPARLREIDDAPLLLHVQGDLGLLRRDAFAVVGSRTATAQGTANAQRFARALSDAGFAIVSGLALGIDAAAHLGGLAGRGSTIAVMGTGIDSHYPLTNRALATRICTEGCLVSEFPLGAAPRRHHFPIRNRVISGLSRGVLVVEAAARSGSLITARIAAEQGRDVFALPGSIHAPLSKGCHELIREGAKLVDTVDHILKDYGMLPAPCEAQMAIELTQAASLLLTVLTYDPMPADELATRLRLDPADTQASLLALELAGVVERLPGGVFQRLKR